MGPYTRAWQGEGSGIDYETVARVFGGLVVRASRAGCAGVRVFVVASRRYIAEGKVAECLDFEAWLGCRLRETMGLVCAYQRSDLEKTAVLKGVLEAHGMRFGLA